MMLEKEDNVTQGEKSSHSMKESGEALGTVQVDLEKENESERKSDIDEKQDGEVDSNEMSARSGGVQESEQDSIEKLIQKKPGQGTSGTKKVNGKSKRAMNNTGHEAKTPVDSSFSYNRPVRERKSVERLVAVIERDPSKDFHIEKGIGTALRDIPNVAYKLSRKKSDDTLKLLHSILFSRRGKAADIKHNISRFSGFVWHGNEEKQKLKIKEKLEKCFKEKLFEFCDILNIPIASKANIKKDEAVLMLLEFLMSPHATTDEILAEKEESSRGKKRKMADNGAPVSASMKTRKKQPDTGRTGDKTNSAETEDESEDDIKENENGATDGALTVDIPDAKISTEELPKKSTSERLSGPNDQTDEDAKQKKRKRTLKNEGADDVKTSNMMSNSKKTNLGPTTETPGGRKKKTTPSKKTTSSPKRTPHNSKQSKADDAARVASPKVSSRKQKNANAEKIAGAVSKEKVGKGVSKENEKSVEEHVKPTNEKLREETCKILKEVDFNTATFTDILKILAERFKADLTTRKTDIKVMIQEELTKLADEEEGEYDGEDCEEGPAPKNETNTSSGQKA
uniref:DEK-C domain-containing protein n=1 Tax=Kalanchoe fedtschenkoi TaxID=63787 RepID=A0A7N0U1X6_KALFE